MDNKSEKLKRFMNDKQMSEAVFGVLLDTFIKPQSNWIEADVSVIAAERIAINLLQNAWRELGKYKNMEKSNQEKQITHV